MSQTRNLESATKVVSFVTTVVTLE